MPTVTILRPVTPHSRSQNYSFPPVVSGHKTSSFCQIWIEWPLFRPGSHVVAHYAAFDLMSMRPSQSARFRSEFQQRQDRSRSIRVISFRDKATPLELFGAGEHTFHLSGSIDGPQAVLSHAKCKWAHQLKDVFSDVAAHHLLQCCEVSHCKQAFVLGHRLA